MSTSSGKVAKLPGYKVIDGTTNDGSLYRQFADTYTWTGKPYSSHPLITPILYHPGAWRGVSSADPESAVTSINLGAAGTIVAKQYGTAWSTSSTLRAPPTTILYWHDLEEMTVDTDNFFQRTGATTPSLTSAYASILTWFDSESTRLAAHNVFVAGINHNTAYRYLVHPFPNYARDSDYSPVVLTNVHLLYDAARFVGGNLLLLTSAEINAYDTTPSASDYYEVTSGVVTTDPNTTVDDPAALQAIYPRFRKLKNIVYLRHHNDVLSVASSNAVLPYHTTLINSLSAYGMEYKGPYTPTTDIQNTVMNDVSSWLDTL